MRTPVIIATMLLATLATPALGQQTAPPSGTLDLGLRFTNISGDEARFQRFRDLGDGEFIERFRFDRQGDRWFLDLSADHAGRLDQRYEAGFQHSDRLKVSFEWDQIPLFISRDTRTFFSQAQPGVLRVADFIQQGIQNGTVQLSGVALQGALFDTKSRRDIARLKLRYSPRSDIDVKLDLTDTRRDGTTPLGTLFSSSNIVELAAPVDTRTTEVASGVEWTGSRGSARVGYDGSWFDNRVPTLVWDNPLRFTDSATASSQGRYALPPDSTLHAVTAVGGVKLPAHSRMSAGATVGAWRQDSALLPFTINTALATIPLDRVTTDGEVRTLAMNYNFTSRPSRYVWLNARLRYYDFDNRTPEFHLQKRVAYDSSVSASPVGSTEPLAYTRHNFDLDTSLTPLSFSAISVGYSRDGTDRKHRIFERTTEDTFRASLDSTAPGWLTMRAIVERSRRTGTGFDQAALTSISEQPAMRHFDIADRDRNRVTGLVQIAPIPMIGLTASAAIGHDDYRNSGFGLRDSKSRAYSTTLDLTSGEAVTAGLSYSYERYTTLQNSRNASPGVQFDDPTRNWGNDFADKIHTVTTNVNLLRLPRRSELRLAYDFTRSRATYVYVLPAGSTLTTPDQLPPILNEIHTGTAEHRTALTDRVAIGFIYRYERYDVDDFQLGPGPRIDTLTQPGGVLLGYVYRPYTASSGWVRLMVNW